MCSGLSKECIVGKESVMAADPRGERLQIMLTREELTAVDSWRFSRHMPSRAAAVRELLRRGLDAEGFAVSDGTTKSGDYGVMARKDPIKIGKAQRG
jgi:hypothetical protein